jgi:hypothetical protein
VTKETSEYAPAMRIAGAATLAGVLIALLAAATSPAGGLATKTIDRTLLCSTLADAQGRRTVGVGVAPRSKYSKALVGVFVSGKAGEYVWPPLVHIVARGPGDPPVHGLWIDTSRCRSVGHRFLLSRAGLRGDLTEVFAEETCAAGRTVLVRVRVTLARWRGWLREPAERGAPGLLRARGLPLAASIAVRSQGRPVAYAMFDGRGQSRLVTTGQPRCRVS